MAIINVDDAYILNETGAQVDKTTGIPFKNESLTEAEAAQARANIRAGGSNDNLLDNAYFVGGGSQLGDGVFPINQRGQSSYSGASIGMDRWRNNGNGTTVLNADNVTFSNTNGWKDGLNQRYAGNRFPLGSQVTFTVQMSDLSYHSCTITVPTTADTQTLDVQAGTSGIYFAVRTNNGYYSQAFVMCDPSTSASIRRAKVELGTVSTLANDPPPDFGEELRKCQRYLWVYKVGANTPIGNGTTFGTSSAIDVVTPVPMRAGNITASFNVTPYIVYDGGLGICDAGAAIISHNGTGNHLRWQIGHSGTNIQGYSLVMLLAGNDTTFTFSNEL